MSLLKSLFTFSIVVGGVAVLLSLGIFKQQREQLFSYIPQSLRDRLFGGQRPVQSNDKLFTVVELEKYRGVDGSDIYLAVLGQVFDVTKGRKHYGPGGTYHFFTGNAGTRAFVSGDFTKEGLKEDLTGLSLQDIQGIAGWVDFYKQQYTYIGKLIGHFYDELGNPTEALEEFKRRYVEAQQKQKEDNEDLRRFPPCNSETKVGISRRLWCSENSGGIKRDWIGVPRQYFQPGHSQARCACVRDSGPPSLGSGSSNNGDLDNPNMKIYDGCEPTATSCNFKD
ncbi:LOW QUALITY PROTEIN: neuferricin-like [Saccostrea cucullata]|uniref:LOW QUALITY PROTEIN: neuferricin-like n=1 Tax=Saccostrea cuccullata TaxID=36930 RepID=UPI002ED4D29D